MAIDWHKITDPATAARIQQSGLCSEVIKPKRKPAHVRGVPNMLEAGLMTYLKLRVPQVLFEPVTFHLTLNRTYTPDFMVVHADRTTTFIEAKGPHEWEDSRLKLEWAAGTFPWYDWFLAKRSNCFVWRFYRVTSRGIARKPETMAWMQGGEM